MVPLRNSAINPNNGFCTQTKTFHSLHPFISFPPLTTPLSLPDYFLTLLHQNTPTTTTSLIDASTRRRVHRHQLPQLIKILASNLQHKFNLSKNDIALILSPNSLSIPILYLALLSIGVIVSPSNPLSSISEISCQIEISKPVIAFVISEVADKVPNLREGIIKIDSTDFESLMVDDEDAEFLPVEVFQNDTAAILYSSGTTGRVKGVELTHGNFISSIAGVNALREARSSCSITFCVVPLFHVYGFLLCVRDVALGGTVVLTKAGRSLDLMMGIVQEFKVTHLPVAPPTVVAMVKTTKSYDLSSLEKVMSGGAPLANSVIEKFNRKFPSISLLQAYGLTETTAGVTRSFGPLESRVKGANGRLVSNCQAKIVDPVTGDYLPPLQAGELWIKGPVVMKGYVGEEEATAATIDSEGWLKTGDVCYFDGEGFLFYVERMKELIKYKGYQVAPAELEDILLSHPAVFDAGVIPFPDEDAGQVPVAFIVREPGSKVDGSQIMNFVARQVAPYKKIRRVFFVESIPKNAPGKILRKELIKLALGLSSKL